MGKLKISAPWYTYQKKLRALFGEDPDIYVGEVFEPDDGVSDYAVDIEIRNHEKYLILDRLLPRFRNFGGVRFSIWLYDEENGNEVEDAVELFRTLFSGNPILKDVKTLIDQTGMVHGFVRFEPRVIQFFNDDLSDYNGNWSGLAQDIAGEVFEDGARGVFFCTADIREPVAEIDLAGEEGAEE